MKHSWLVLLLLVGCANPGPNPSPSPSPNNQPTDIIQLTHQDLQNAAGISQMFGDMDHGNECFTWMDQNLTAVQQLFGNAAPTNVTGLFSALEAVNVGVNLAQGNSPALLAIKYDMEKNCGPYVMNLAGGVNFLAGKALGAAKLAPLMAK